MCNICVFAGTTEGRELVEFLAGQPVQATVCVAMEYGETLLPEAENITILAGRIPVEDIIRMLQRMRFDLVIDATHPYATSITESICTACRETETEYLRLLRQSSEQTEDVVCVENAAAAAAFLESTRGNILLTTGSKELAAYSGIPDFTQRVYARVLPMDASLEACRAAHFILNFCPSNRHSDRYWFWHQSRDQTIHKIFDLLPCFCIDPSIILFYCHTVLPPIQVSYHK